MRAQNKRGTTSRCAKNIRQLITAYTGLDWPTLKGNAKGRVQIIRASWYKGYNRLSRLAHKLSDYYRSDEFPLNKYCTRALDRPRKSGKRACRPAGQPASGLPLCRSLQENQENERTARSPAFHHLPHCTPPPARRYFRFARSPARLNFRTSNLLAVPNIDVWLSARVFRFREVPAFYKSSWSFCPFSKTMYQKRVQNTRSLQSAKCNNYHIRCQTTLFRRLSSQTISYFFFDYVNKLGLIIYGDRK